MKNYKTLGLGLIISSLMLFIIEKASSLALSTWLAMQVCGESYMKEPDQALAQQGVLTEKACGFNADMMLVAGLAVLLLVGIVILYLFRDRNHT